MIRVAGEVIGLSAGMVFTQAVVRSPQRLAREQGRGAVDERVLSLAQSTDAWAQEVESGPALGFFDEAPARVQLRFT